MGQIYGEHSFNAKEYSKDTIIGMMYDDCECETRRDFQGEIIFFDDIILDSKEEASSYIGKNTYRNDGIYAVRFSRPSETVLQSNKAYQKVKQMHTDALKEQEVAFKKNYFEDRKSKTVGCSHCGSKINKDFIYNNDCPVCRKSLLSPTIVNTLKRKLKKVIELGKRMEEMKTQLAKKPKNCELYWYVETHFPD